MPDVSRKVLAATAADVAVASCVPAHKGLKYLGYAVRESDGTPAVAALNICQGAVANGDFLAVIELAANATDKAWHGPDGLGAPDGISVDRVAGTFDLVIFYRHDPVPNP